MDIKVKEKEGLASGATGTNPSGGLARRDFDPFHTMQQVMEEMFESFRPFGFSPWLERSGGGRNLSRWQGGYNYMPAFDVKERVDAYAIEADLPGVKEKDLDISLNGNRLVISGKREESRREEGSTYYSLERQYGTFSRVFTLPVDCDAEHITAEFDNGVLSVLIPKKEAAKPRKITLKERIKRLAS